MDTPYYNPTDLNQDGSGNPSVGAQAFHNNPMIYNQNMLQYYPYGAANLGLAAPLGAFDMQHFAPTGFSSAESEPPYKKSKLSDDDLGPHLMAQPIQNRPHTSKPKTQYRYRTGDSLEYFCMEDSFYGKAWYSVVVSSRGQKTIGSKTVPFYVVNWPDKDHSISVEEWRLRIPIDQPRSADLPPQGTSLTNITHTVPRDTLVECSSIIDSPGGTKMKVWFMAKLVSECKPGTKASVIYLNELWNKDKTAIPIERGCVRVVLNDPTTEMAWRKATPPCLLSDEEHLIASMVSEANAICSALDKKVAQTTVESFENDRDRLCEILDSLTNSRHYDKAIDILKFMQSFELRISGNLQ